MIAADNFATGAAQRAQEPDVFRRIDREAIGLVRQIARGMKAQDFDPLFASHAFDQAAAFAWIGRARFGEELGMETPR